MISEDLVYSRNSSSLGHVKLEGKTVPMAVLATIAAAFIEGPWKATNTVKYVGTREEKVSSSSCNRS